MLGRLMRPAGIACAMGAFLAQGTALTVVLVAVGVTLFTLGGRRGGSHTGDRDPNSPLNYPGDTSWSGGHHGGSSGGESGGHHGGDAGAAVGFGDSGGGWGDSG